MTFAMGGISRAASLHEGILSVTLELVQRNNNLSRVEGELSVLSNCSHIHGVPLEIQ